MTRGQNIQNARRAQGLSQEALAEKIGVSRQALGIGVDALRGRHAVVRNDRRARRQLCGGRYRFYGGQHL